MMRHQIVAQTTVQSRRFALISLGCCANSSTPMLTTARAGILQDQRRTFSTDEPVTLSDMADKFQHLIRSRRTVSNFVTLPSWKPSSTQQSSFLYDAISRGVACAVTAPNHRITEPTTFHRILSPSAATERLLDIAYETALHILLDNKLSGEEACRSEAMRKREKWSKIPAFVVAAVCGMEDQTLDAASDGGICTELPYVPPATIQQLEDYASACASIQNLL